MTTQNDKMNYIIAIDLMKCAWSTARKLGYTREQIEHMFDDAGEE